MACPAGPSVTERDGAGVGLLEGGDGAHEGRLAGAVRAEEPEHAARDRQRDVTQRVHPVGVRLCEVLDPEFHGAMTGRSSVAVYVLHYILRAHAADGFKC